MNLDININGNYGTVGAEIKTTIMCVETNEKLLNYIALSFSDATDEIKSFIENFDEEKYDKDNLLDYETFIDTNESEINCIFAETGMDREIDFDKEREEEDMYFNEGTLYKKYTQLQRYKKNN